MNIQDLVHDSWLSCIMPELYKEPLNTLHTGILPNISFQPSQKNIFKAFEMPLKKVKVVIVGEEPSSVPNISNGLAFASNHGVPKSLQNIYKEILTSTLMYAHSKEIDGNTHHYADINSWTEQGVLLLNTALTVETAHAGSHLQYWEQFTKSIIYHISMNQPCIWLFLGKSAHKCVRHILVNPYNATKYDRNTIENIPINDDYNYILIAEHPETELNSKGENGFFGCDHFYKINKILLQTQQVHINW